MGYNFISAKIRNSQRMNATLYVELIEPSHNDFPSLMTRIRVSSGSMCCSRMTSHALRATSQWHSMVDIQSQLNPGLGSWKNAKIQRWHLWALTILYSLFCSLLPSWVCLVQHGIGIGGFFWSHIHGGSGNTENLFPLCSWRLNNLHYADFTQVSKLRPLSARGVCLLPGLSPVVSTPSGRDCLPFP